MKIKVMKFGGSSLADPDKIQRAAQRAARERRRGFPIAVVVSAPGDMTDELLGLARRLARKTSAREMDSLMAAGEQVSASLLAGALGARGCPAVSLSGAQAGVRARGPHGAAAIAGVRPARVLSELARGRVAVVAGFQGANAVGDVATLGRGGSDLTAVALAAALRAEACEIFTDVRGIYTADPRLEPRARLLPDIGFSEMLRLAAAGAQVMQPRSIAYARARGVPIHVRSAFYDADGTWIGRGDARALPIGVKALAVLREGKLSRLTAVGRGLGFAAAELGAEALADRGVAHQGVRRTSGSVSCLVNPHLAVAALRAWHDAYGLTRLARA